MAFRFQVNQNPLTIEFEAGSVKEGLAILQAEESTLADFFATAARMSSGGGDAQSVQPPTTSTAPDKPKRGRPAKGAEAPPPAPVPGSAPPAPPAPPAPVSSAPPAPTGDGLQIPPFLDRTQPPAPPAPPVPPPVPPAPPAAPVADPKFELGRKIAADIKLKAADDATKAQFADWLKSCGVVTQQASFDDALSVLEFLADDKAKPIADMLGVK